MKSCEPDAAWGGTVGRGVNTGAGVETWQDRAKCKGASAAVFYPLRGVPTASARALCKDCPVKADCLAYALENEEEFGIWGGLSERERRKLIRARTRLRNGEERRLSEAS